MDVGARELVLGNVKRFSERISTDFANVLLFGSLVIDGGRQFQVRRTDENPSDIDLMLVWKDKALDFSQRATSIERLYQHVLRLEVDLMQTLKWKWANKSITSVIPVHPIEYYLCIHKGGDYRIFSDNLFVDFLSQDQEPKKLEVYPDSTFLNNYDSLISTLKYCQGIRNKFLNVSPNGTLGLEEYTGDDALEKSLVRQAQILHSDLNVVSGEKRTDIEEGIEFISSQLRSRRNDPSCNDLYHLLMDRRNNRTDSKPVDRLSTLRLSELMYDLAAEKLLGTTKLRLDRFLTEKGV